MKKENIEVEKNGIRHIIVDHRGMVIPENKLKSYNKFKGTEYLVTEKYQILPLLAIIIERVEYLIVWRDNNFSE